MMAPLVSITSHGKANIGTYMINLFGSIIPILAFLAYASSQINSLTTEHEVEELIEAHNISKMHPDAKAAIREVQKQLDSILSFQIEDRIEKQLKIVCEDSHFRDAIEPTVKQLIRDYNKLSVQNFTRPTCAQLGVIS